MNTYVHTKSIALMSAQFKRTNFFLIKEKEMHILIGALESDSIKKTATLKGLERSLRSFNRQVDC
jgi:hypothetical protein